MLDLSDANNAIHILMAKRYNEWKNANILRMQKLWIVLEGVVHCVISHIEKEETYPFLKGRANCECTIGTCLLGQCIPWLMFPFSWPSCKSSFKPTARTDSVLLGSLELIWNYRIHQYRRTWVSNSDISASNFSYGPLILVTSALIWTLQVR